MKDKIGKYKLRESNDDLQVHYTYGIGDLISFFFYLIGLTIGLLFLYISVIHFDNEKFWDFEFWLMAVIGLLFIGYFLFLIIGGLYRPVSGILQVDKKNKTVEIRDIFKNEKIPFDEIASIFCELTTTVKPKQKFGIMRLRTKDGKLNECFIVRSSIPIDLGRKVDKDIYETANLIKDRIYKAMNK